MIGESGVSVPCWPAAPTVRQRDRKWSRTGTAGIFPDQHASTDGVIARVQAGCRPGLTPRNTSADGRRLPVRAGRSDLLGSLIFETGGRLMTTHHKGELRARSSFRSSATRVRTGHLFGWCEEGLDVSWAPLRWKSAFGRHRCNKPRFSASNKLLRVADRRQFNSPAYFRG